MASDRFQVRTISLPNCNCEDSFEEFGEDVAQSLNELDAAGGRLHLIMQFKDKGVMLVADMHPPNALEQIFGKPPEQKAEVHDINEAHVQELLTAFSNWVRHEKKKILLNSKSVDARDLAEFLLIYFANASYEHVCSLKESLIDQTQRHDDSCVTEDCQSGQLLTLITTEICRYVESRSQ